MSKRSGEPAERLELAEWAYQGEISGEALFAGLRDTEPDQRLQAHFEVLRLLESQTAALLSDLVVRIGGTAAPSDQARQGGQRTADQARQLSRTALLESFAPGTRSAIAKYQRLRLLVDNDEQGVVDQVIAHEEALQAFADSSLAGADDPTEPVVAQLRTPWLASVPDRSVLVAPRAD